MEFRPSEAVVISQESLGDSDGKVWLLSCLWVASCGVKRCYKEGSTKLLEFTQTYVLFVKYNNWKLYENFPLSKINQNTTRFYIIILLVTHMTTRKHIYVAFYDDKEGLLYNNRNVCISSKRLILLLWQIKSINGPTV